MNRTSPSSRPALWLCLLVAATTACAKRGPRDVDNQNPRSEFPDDGSRGVRKPTADGGIAVLATPNAMGRKPRVLVRANSRALAVDSGHLYYGASEEDALFAVEKRAEGGNAEPEPKRLARRAPTTGALSFDAHDATLSWIGTPGDIVLRISAKGGTPVTVRDRGIFTDVVAAGGDVFITEAQGAGGVLTRVTGTTAARLATIEGTPRGIVVDDDRVYVATSSRLSATSRSRGEVVDLARGGGFASPQIDDAALYATMADPKSRGRVLVRVKKSGGPLETVSAAVRDAPIAVYKGNVYWFDAERNALLAAPATDARPAGPRVVSDDPVFAQPNALVVDDDGAFVATGNGAEARIVVIPLR